MNFLASASAITIGTQLTCDAIPGLDGVVIARGIEDGEPIAVVRVEGTMYTITLRTMVDNEGDRWEVKPKTRTVYQNVYTDGTFGDMHDDHAKAVTYSRYYKTRVGILTKEIDDKGVVVRAQMNATTPQLRDHANPNGINPYVR